MELINNEFGVITYDSQTEIMLFTWKDKLLSKEKFKEMVSTLAENVENKKTKSIYVDARLNKFTMSEDIREWHDNEIVGKYVGAGVKKMGFVMPKSLFSEMTHKSTFDKQNAKELLPTQFFNSEEDTLNWLKEG